MPLKGAKSAGIKLALYPIENHIDMLKLRKCANVQARSPRLHVSTRGGDVDTVGRTFGHFGTFR